MSATDLAARADRPPSEPGLDAGAEEERAMARLHERMVVAVRKTCPPTLRDRADDLVQVAVLRVLKLRRERPERTFSDGYLYRTAYSALIDEIRRLRRRGEVPLETPTDDGDERPLVEPTVEDADPEQRAGARELGVAITDCLGRLVPDRRRAVVLYLQGHGVPEAARLLRWGAKRVQNLVYRGLADLRGCLEAKGLDGGLAAGKGATS
ncbi:MAG: RNA polymerase sigma factor [Acidobacteriota bacterium]